jgi:carbonic anhydrase
VVSWGQCQPCFFLCWGLEPQDDSISARHLGGSILRVNLLSFLLGVGRTHTDLIVRVLSSFYFYIPLFQGGDCTPQDFSFEINPHAEQANAPKNDNNNNNNNNNSTCQTSSMRIPGMDGTFELIQFHVHLNSEHTLDGSHFAAELHLVHMQQQQQQQQQQQHYDDGGSDDDSGSRRGLAVVAMFLTPTALERNPILDEILLQWDAIQDETYRDCDLTEPTHWWWSSSSSSFSSSSSSLMELNLYDLIPQGSTFYHYKGGLTTPPCSEIVDWTVIDQPVKITVSQFQDLSSLTLNFVDSETCTLATIADPNSGSTSRPVQPLNGRTITRICPVGYRDTTHKAGATVVATLGIVLVAAIALALLVVSIRHVSNKCFWFTHTVVDETIETMYCDTSSSSPYKHKIHIY